MKSIGIGTSDFRDLITENLYYVDKTLMIKEIIEDTSRIILLPRPRRFGKTLNMSMLYYFFDRRDAATNKKLFEGLNISTEPVFEREQGKYPVIFISLKDVKSLNFNDAFEQISYTITKLYSALSYQINFNKIGDEDKNIVEAILNRTANKAILADSLKLLTELLYTSTGIRPILLIDEYDTPIHASYSNNYYESMISFMGVFLGAALKDNVNLHKGVLTGTLRVSKESIFTGLNNISVCSLLRSEYCNWFGFTNEELHQLLVYYKLEELEPSIKAWYNGYIFGRNEIYNPWSILNFVKSEDKHFIAHWVNTANNDLIKELIVNSTSAVREQLRELLNDKPIIKTLDENIVFKDLLKSSDAVFSFLVFSGYLKANLLKFEDSSYWYELSIPNKEVKKLFGSIILNWINESLENETYTQLLKALTEGDTETFELIMNDFVINTLSCFHLQKTEVERVYQAFTLGLLVSLSNRYEVNAEKESGYGRYDIALIPFEKNKKAVIIELKKINFQQDETKDLALSSALKQIEDRQYDAAIRQRGYDDILKLAIVFDGKRVWVKSGKA